MLVEKNIKYFQKRSSKINPSKINVRRLSVKHDSSYYLATGEVINPHLISVEIRLFLGDKKSRIIARASTQVKNKYMVEDAFEKLKEQLMCETEDFVDSLTLAF